LSAARHAKERSTSQRARGDATRARLFPGLIAGPASELLRDVALVRVEAVRGAGEAPGGVRGP
jgi:hypothetical protein